MSLTLQGTIERKAFGPGVWVLVSDDGQTYELRQAPKQILKAGVRVEVCGDIQEDGVSLAMVGPILVVQSMDILT